jgi:hypothetical protein
VGNPIKDMNDYIILTGTTKNFKLQQTCDQLEALVDILDTEATDRNGRIWKRECMKKILNNREMLEEMRVKHPALEHLLGKLELELV